MTRRGIVVNKTEYPATQALMPKPIAIWDFPLRKVYDKGKTHIATSIGINACKNKKKVLFTSAIDLVEKMSIYQKKGDLKKLFKSLSKIDLLIIDEMGHLVLDKEKESMIFQLIRQRYEKNSLIITTNIPLGSWDKIFTSILSATAVLDRLVHHCHVISIPGDSYRVKRKQKEM